MVSGVINFYKEQGVTSQGAVTAVKKIFGGAKAGHAGTLDPMARGVLPVCLGKATKIADYLQAENKTYAAVMRLGVTTDTEDITGNVLTESEVNAGIKEINEACGFFSGEYMQTPPMYSAVSVNGKRLYKLARAGIAVERPAKKVFINAIRILSVDLPDVSMAVDCSKGTYIRTLAADIGRRLGCGACLAALERTRTGDFYSRDSVTLNQLKEADDKNRFVIPVEDALKYKKLAVMPEALKPLYNGRGVSINMVRGGEDINEGEKIFINDEEGLIGIYARRGITFELLVMLK